MKGYTIDDIKKKSLEKSIHESARRCAELYYEGNTVDCYEDDNKDDDVNERIMDDGRVRPNWLDDDYCDQVSEWLFGDNQACDIIFEKKLFDENDFVGKYEEGNVWNLLEKYFNSDEVEDIFYDEWHSYLGEMYGPNWKYM